MNKVPKLAHPRAPAHIAPYVDVLGVELAIRFFMGFGGSTISLPRTPGGRGEIEQLIGAPNVVALHDHFGSVPHRCPIPKRWLAHVWFEQGLSVQEISRKLHCADFTVRRHLKRDPDTGRHRATAPRKDSKNKLSQDPRQLKLF